MQTHSTNLTTSGTITLGGEVARKVDLTVQNGNIDFGDVSAGESASSDTSTSIADPGFKIKTVKLKVRSNTPYEIKLAAFSTSGMTAAEEGSELGLNDIGITVGESTFASGAVLTSATQSGAFNMNDSAYYYANNPGGKAATISNGHASYVRTLASQTSEFQLYRGSAVSNQGNAKSNDNFVRTSVHFLIAPEFYAPTASFNATATVSIMALPSLN